MPSVPTLLIDTDLFADVDDVGALAVAHAYARRGACRIAAIVLDTPSRHGVPAVRAINAFYDADVPVGAFRKVRVRFPGHGEKLFVGDAVKLKVVGRKKAE